MEIEQLREFFFWCMVINFGIYALTAVAVFAFHGTIVKVHKRMFGMEEGATSEAIHRYLGGYKLLTSVFSFVPWLALVIMR